MYSLNSPTILVRTYKATRVEIELNLPSFYTETRVPLFYNSALAVASTRAGLLVLERSSRVDYCAPAPRRIWI